MRSSAPTRRPPTQPPPVAEGARARPHPLLRPGVLGYGGFRLAQERPRLRLELPAGCVTLLFAWGAGMRLVDAVRGGEPRTYTSLISGMHTTAALGEHGGRLTGVQVLLAPWAAFRLLDVPLRELAETWTPPGEVLGRRFRSLLDALAEAGDWAARFALLDEALVRWYATGPAPAEQVEQAWESLAAADGMLRIPDLADSVGWSTRRLEQRFREQIGLTPKAAARALRLRHAARRLAGGESPAETALACGFYDQAHFNREFRAMAGCTPGAFLAFRGAADVPGLDRLEGQVTSALLDALPG